MSTQSSIADRATHHIDVHVAELKQLFNSLDPSPFHERDLDSRAEEYIVDWARELPRDGQLKLVIHLDRCEGMPNETQLLEESIHQYFRDRSRAARRRLKQLFRYGRISLVIGIAFLAAAAVTARIIENMLGTNGFTVILRESVVIGGWVAMWRPLEIFLYDWWPILTDARLYERLGAMPVRIKYLGLPSDAWRQDWPAVAPSERA